MSEVQQDEMMGDEARSEKQDNELKNYVQILEESLEKKVAVLEQIVLENGQQAEILTDPAAGPDEFHDNVDRKENLIQQIQKLDDGFSALFDRIKLSLEREREQYKEQIERMQELVRRVTELGAKVRDQEQTNYKLAEKKFANVRGQAQKVRKSERAVSQYYQSMGKLDFGNPQFFDDQK